MVTCLSSPLADSASAELSPHPIKPSEATPSRAINLFRIEPFISHPLFDSDLPYCRRLRVCAPSRTPPVFKLRCGLTEGHTPVTDRINHIQNYCDTRSEERRVGKEWRSAGWGERWKKR